MRSCNGLYKHHIGNRFPKPVHLVLKTRCAGIWYDGSNNIYYVNQTFFKKFWKHGKTIDNDNFSGKKESFNSCNWQLR